MAADDFFVDLFETAIGDDEILTEVRIPKHTGWGAHYEKFVRVAHQWPIVAVAADGAGGRRHHRRGAGRADQHGLDAAAGARRSRRRWPGSRRPPTRVRAAAAERAAEGTNPPSDLNGDADYRRHLAARAHPPRGARRRGG